MQEKLGRQACCKLTLPPPFPIPVESMAFSLKILGTSDNDRGTVPFYMIIYDDALLRYWGLEE